MFTEHGTHTFGIPTITDCYSLLLVVEHVLLELLVPALKFFKLILQVKDCSGAPDLVPRPPRATMNT